MSSNSSKKIFFIFVEQSGITGVKIYENDKNKKSYEIKKVSSVQTEKGMASLFCIDFFKTSTNSTSIFLIFQNKFNKNLFSDIKFKNDRDNFIYDFDIYEDTGTLYKIVTVGYYNKKLYEYIRLNKSKQFNIFLEYLNNKYSKEIKPGNQKDSLITQTISLITRETKKSSFALYLTLLREIIRFEKIVSLIIVFKIEKFSYEERVNPQNFTKLFKSFLKNPDYFDRFLKSKKEEIKKKFI